MVVCILVYPEDGEQASVKFVDLASYRAGAIPADRPVLDAIKRALGGEDGVSVTDDDWVSASVDAHFVEPPCHVAAAITLYLDT
jgi:hypothetical protein